MNMKILINMRCYTLALLFAAGVIMSCSCAPEKVTDDDQNQGPVESSLQLPSKKATLETYKYALDLPPSTRFWVNIDGEDQFCYPTEEPDITAFGCDDTVVVVIECLSEKINKVVVRPLSKEPEYEFKDDKITLLMKPYDRYIVEINGNEDKPLFLFANPLQSTMGVSKDDPNVKWYEAGKVYEAENTISLESGQTLFIEGGAVVEGHVYCKGVSNVTINGGGILKCWPRENQTAVYFMECNDISLNNVTVVNETKWTTQMCHCSGITAVNWKAIATWNHFNNTGCENDAFDIFGSNTMTVKYGFSYAHDDTFCIKSRKFNYNAPVYDISYEDCIAWNVNSGNSFQIGYELGQNVTNVSYKDIYSVHSAGSANPLMRGAVSIINAADGIVDGITYENVYIEDPKEFGFFFNIRKSAYNLGVDENGNQIYWTKPGIIRNVTIKNMHILKEPPKGYVLDGFDADHGIENFVFDGLYVCGQRITDLSQIGIKSKYADVEIK